MICVKTGSIVVIEVLLNTIGYSFAMWVCFLMLTWSITSNAIENYNKQRIDCNKEPKNKSLLHFIIVWCISTSILTILVGGFFYIVNI